MESGNSDIYAKWLLGQLSEAEARQLKESGEAAILERIVAEADSWEMPASKTSYAHLKQKLTEKRRTKEAKIHPLFKPLAIAAGVAVVALLSILYYNSGKITSIETAAGETKIITMPDSTGITLAGNSVVSYLENDWENNRVLELKGGAYFEVRKKGDFVVNFDGGLVSVKGTGFNVIATKDFKQVKCYHGKVIATLSNRDFALSPGMGVDSGMETFTFTVSEPQQGGAYQKFENAKLAEVLASLTSQFGYKFEQKKDYSNKLFTGQYDKTDGAKALDMVLSSLSIAYEVKGKQVILK